MRARACRHAHRHPLTPVLHPDPQTPTRTAASDARASRAVRPHDAPRPRVPALLPASVRAHHPVRAQRHAPSCLHRSPCRPAGAPRQRTAAPLATPPILLPCCSLSQTPPPPSFAPQLFLSSSGLPNYLVAAFAKRLGRLALTAPAPTAVLALGIVYNLLLQHKAVRILIHRRADAEVIAAPACPEAAASSDTFVESEDDPAACRATTPPMGSRLAALAHVPDSRLGRLALLCPNDAEYPARRPARTRTGRGAALASWIKYVITSGAIKKGRISRAGKKVGRRLRRGG